MSKNGEEEEVLHSSPDISRPTSRADSIDGLVEHHDTTDASENPTMSCPGEYTQ